MVTWNADADAKLFAAFIKVHNVKIDYHALAAEMGGGCTAKAITHRIAKLKTQGGAVTTGGSPTSNSATPAKRTPAKRAPAKSTGRGKKGKDIDEDDDDDFGGERDYDKIDENDAVATPSAGRTRPSRGTPGGVKRSYAESDDGDEIEEKRVKREDSINGARESSIQLLFEEPEFTDFGF